MCRSILSTNLHAGNFGTPHSLSHSQSRSPARYLQRGFREGVMREEEHPLSCESAIVFMHSFLVNTNVDHLTSILCFQSATVHNTSLYIGREIQNL